MSELATLIFLGIAFVVALVELKTSEKLLEGILWLSLMAIDGVGFLVYYFTQFY